MRLALVLTIALFTLSSFGSRYTIPQKLRGRYRCEVPGYDIVHNGVVTKVAPLTALLFVYKTKIIIRIDEKSYSSNVDKKNDSRKSPIYDAVFPAPFYSCVVRFDRKEKSVLIEAPIFKDNYFYRIK